MHYEIMQGQLCGSGLQLGVGVHLLVIKIGQNFNRNITVTRLAVDRVKP